MSYAFAAIESTGGDIPDGVNPDGSEVIGPDNDGSDDKATVWTISSSGTAMPYCNFTLLCSSVPVGEKLPDVTGCFSGGDALSFRIKNKSYSGGSYSLTVGVESINRKKAACAFALLEDGKTYKTNVNYSTGDMVPACPGEVFEKESWNWTISFSNTSTYGKFEDFKVAVKWEEGINGSWIATSGFSSVSGAWGNGVLHGTGYVGNAFAGDQLRLSVTYAGVTKREVITVQREVVINAPSSLHIYGEAKTLKIGMTDFTGASIVAYETGTTTTFSDWSLEDGSEVSFANGTTTGHWWEGKVMALASGSTAYITVCVVKGGVVLESKDITIVHGYLVDLVCPTTVKEYNNFAMAVQVAGDNGEVLTRFENSLLTIAATSTDDVAWQDGDGTGLDDAAFKAAGGISDDGIQARFVGIGTVTVTVTDSGLSAENISREVNVTAAWSMDSLITEINKRLTLVGLTSSVIPLDSTDVYLAQTRNNTLKSYIYDSITESSATVINNLEQPNYTSSQISSMTITEVNSLIDKLYVVVTAKKYISGEYYGFYSQLNPYVETSEGYSGSSSDQNYESCYNEWQNKSSSYAYTQQIALIGAGLSCSCSGSGSYAKSGYKNCVLRLNNNYSKDCNIIFLIMKANIPTNSRGSNMYNALDDFGYDFVKEDTSGNNEYFIYKRQNASSNSYWQFDFNIKLPYPPSTLFSGNSVSKGFDISGAKTILEFFS